MSDARPRHAHPSSAMSPRRILCLGDSYTIGEGVAERERWPMQLADWLRVRGIAAAAPTIVARTGWTTTELAAALDAAVLAPPYDLVTLLIGVNDQYRDWPETEFPARHAALLDRAVGYAGEAPSRCLVVSIPDWGVTDFGARDRRGPETIAAAIDRYNAIARANAEARGVAFTDVTAISRSPERKSALADDGLHPSGAQYRAWVEDAIGPAALRILGG